MKKTKNYIDYKGNYINIENKTLTEIYNEGKLDGLIEGIKKQTEIIKAVVICKDCKHRDPENKKCDCGMPERAGNTFPVDDNYSCAYGERKESRQ